jgi:hypothetical protein
MAILALFAAIKGEGRRLVAQSVRVGNDKNTRGFSQVRVIGRMPAI